MDLLEQTVKGWTEIIIDSDCEVYKFYKIADVVETKLRIDFNERIKRADQLFWQFTIEETDFVLFYIPAEGAGLYASSQIVATETELSLLRLVAKSLYVQLVDFDWTDYLKGQTIGTISESRGVILSDIANYNGARISLEKDAAGGPYAVVYDLYGWLKRSHVETNKGAAEEFVFQLKTSINAFFDLYDIPEYKQKETWKKKHDRLLKEIADMSTRYEKSDDYKKSAPVEKGKRVWWKRILGMAGR
jgi:hypothetical protein